MSEASLPLDPDAMRLIAEIGFIGAQAGQAAASRALFQALQVLRPESTLPFIGRAMAELGSDQPQEAARILRDEGLKQYPADAELMAFLGLALHEAGQSAESNKILCAVVAQGTGDEPHVRMAMKLLSLGVLGKQTADLLPPWSQMGRQPAEQTR